jgi:hypothetical protein
MLFKRVIRISGSPLKIITKYSACGHHHIKIIVRFENNLSMM